MIRKMRWLLALVLILPGTMYAQEKSCDELMSKAESLWLDDYVESNKVLDEAMKVCPERAELYWRKARNHYDILEDLPREKKPPKDKLIQNYREVENLGKKCEELAPEDGSCYLWHAIGMGRRGTTQGVLNSLGDIDEMEGLLIKAIELKPTYRAEGGVANSMADACNALGQFYRVVPDWRFLAWVFGAKGDMDKSVEYQRRAVELEPQRIEYVKELGVSLLCRGEKKGSQDDIKEGEKYLRKVLELPAMKPTDTIDKDHARMLLEEHGLACGYSRDEQQEVSKEAYDKKDK
jgi:tetratricopeptide (TPR) repeat protein